MTTLAVLAILHVRSRLYEAIRLSIYDAEKPDITRSTSITTLPRDKANPDGRIPTITCNSEILTPSFDYGMNFKISVEHYSSRTTCRQSHDIIYNNMIYFQ